MPDDPLIRELRLSVPQHQLDDLHDRLARARWAETETVRGPGGEHDWSQGVPRGVLADVVRYWVDGYDWRRVEAELNAHGQALTEIDGLDVHFLHARSPRAEARAVVITHGWPSSVLEPMTVMRDLTDPGSDDQAAFHVVAPSLPGFGFGGIPSDAGWTVARTADAWAELMTRLGYDTFYAAGGDWGGRVTAALADRHPHRLLGLHTFTPYIDHLPADTTGLSPVEAGWVAETRSFLELGGGYSLEQSTRPQTVGYSLVDSPLGLLAWILEKFVAWTDWRDDPFEAVSLDRVLDTVMLYWLSATGASAARFYWQNYPPDNGRPVTVPTGVTVFPADIEKLPRRWVESRFTDIRYWQEAERGGHFPMLEVPGSYVAQLRAAFAAMAL